MDLISVFYEGSELTGKTRVCVESFKKRHFTNIDHFAEMLMDYRFRVDAETIAKKTKNDCIKKFGKHRNKLPKPETCQHCGNIPKKLHGHHEDYSKPFDVIWLCFSCHRHEHKGKRMEDFHPYLVFKRPKDFVSERYMSYRECSLTLATLQGISEYTKGEVRIEDMVTSDG